jgi:hypothetical protein
MTFVIVVVPLLLLLLEAALLDCESQSVQDILTKSFVVTGMYTLLFPLTVVARSVSVAVGEHKSCQTIYLDCPFYRYGNQRFYPLPDYLLKPSEQFPPQQIETLRHFLSVF